MSKKGRSLVNQLVWRIIAVQAVIMFSAIAWLTHSLYRTNVSYMDERTTSIIANALRINGNGGISFVREGEINEVLQSFPNLWFVVDDGKGQRLTYGAVPEMYRSLSNSLSRLQRSDVHDNQAPYGLTMKADIADAPFGRVHVMCGGAGTSNPTTMFLFIIHYLGWRMTLPLAIVTFIVMPWLIRRSVSGVEEVARQAAMINIDERGIRLEDQAVPREVRPVVQAFNGALERLEEGYEARDRFLAGAAHELRVPIAILEARIETLTAGTAQLRLRADLARLSNLAEQLLDLQRLGRQQSSFGPVDLSELAREVVADVAPLVVDAGYDIALNAPEVPVWIIGDRLSLTRVLTNLLQNAVAHGGGQGLISIDVETSGAFGVRDEGPGIPPNMRLRIFEPFYRLQQNSVGAGLGLHLVREIVMLHGGRVEVTEARGGGAWFRVHLRPMAPLIATTKPL